MAHPGSKSLVIVASHADTIFGRNAENMYSIHQVLRSSQHALIEADESCPFNWIHINLRNGHTVFLVLFKKHYGYVCFVRPVIIMLDGL